MLRSVLLRAVLAVAVLVPMVALADAYDDLVKVQTAFQNAKSWHAVEQFSNGHTVIVDYVAPDRWRIQPNPDMTELLIGGDAYMVRKGRTTHLPFGGMMQKMIKDLRFSANDEMKQSARDLGMQTLNGQSVHVYTFTSHGIPATLYVGSDLLPVQNVVKDKKNTTTIIYSNYNAPITIEP
ncbi:MAG TPA: hypothetical protein VKT29_05995 [Terriglobales bacterium]|nr:hypothetical protein [Terriglobales bacterium]